jgi:hypothetical protein
MPCSLFQVYQHFRSTCCLHHHGSYHFSTQNYVEEWKIHLMPGTLFTQICLPWWWRQKNNFKHLYTSARLHGNTTQKTANLKVMAKLTSNLTESIHIIHAMNHMVKKLQHSIKLQAFRHSSTVKATICLLTKVWGNLYSVLTYLEQARFLATSVFTKYSQVTCYMNWLCNTPWLWKQKRLPKHLIIILIWSSQLPSKILSTAATMNASYLIPSNVILSKTNY